MDEIPNQPPEPVKPDPGLDLYDLTVRLAMHSQENKLQTLNLYLVFNSILLLAWTTLFPLSSTNLGAKLAASLFCVLGLLFALVWLPLGWDYANASDSFSKMAEHLEEKLPQGLRPLRSRAEQKGNKVPIGSRTLLLLVPLVFLMSYIFLLVLAWAAK